MGYEQRHDPRSPLSLYPCTRNIPIVPLLHYGEMHMPLTLPPQTEGTEKYADWEDGVYNLTLVDMSEDTEGKYGPQYKLQFRLPETEDEQGNPHVINCWVSMKLSFTPGKETHLGKAVAALLGRQPEKDEHIDDTHLIGQSCTAVVNLTEKGYPRIDKDTFAKVRRGKRPAPVVEAEDDPDEVPFD